MIVRALILGILYLVGFLPVLAIRSGRSLTIVLAAELILFLGLAYWWQLDTSRLSGLFEAFLITAIGFGFVSGLVSRTIASAVGSYRRSAEGPVALISCVGLFLVLLNDWSTMMDFFH